MEFISFWNCIIQSWRLNLHSLLKLEINGKNGERESISLTPREIKECKLNYHLRIVSYWLMNAWLD